MAPVPGIIIGTGASWGKGESADISPSIPYADAKRADSAATLNADDAGAPLDPVLRVRFGESLKRDRATSAPWQHTDPQWRGLVSRWGAPPQADIDAVAMPWGRPDVADRLGLSVPFIALLPAKDVGVDVPWQSTRLYADDGGPQPRDMWLVSIRAGAIPRDVNNGIPWGPSGARDTSFTFVYPTYTGPVVVPGEPPAPYVQLSYYFMNLITVVRLPDRVPIAVHNVTMALDIDSWAWTFSGDVQGFASLSAIAPSASGPVDIEVVVNGWKWVFMIEAYSGSRKFSDDVYTVRGVSRTQLMAAPYAPLRSGLVGSQISARQLAEEQLQNTGFLLNWDSSVSDESTPDWVIPANGWAYRDQAPAQLIRRIVETAGAVLLPARDADAFNVQPRYKVSPWALAGATPDVALAMDMVDSVGVTWSPMKLYDSVHVSGSSSGVGYLATRSGSAGNSPAPDVVDDLALTVDVNRERCRQIIAASGNQAVYSLSLPLPESAVQPGLVEVGSIAEVFEGASSWRGYVLSAAVSLSGDGVTDVSQQVSIVRFHEHS